MNDALAVPGTVVLLGGTSDIGLAIVGQLVARGTRTVVLAGRDRAALQHAGERLGDAKVHVVSYDSTDDDAHTATVDEIASMVGDIDMVVCAVGVLGEQEQLEQDPIAASQLLRANFVGPAATLLAVTQRMRTQGHGRLVVLSSVAGERVRGENFIYGSSKAGLDGFSVGLGDAVAASGIDVLVVRPGFVRTRMTAGREAVPFTSTAEEVAAATIRALERGDARTRGIVWVPGILRLVMIVLRHMPRKLFRRLFS
jgi:decaprenylphospho-beta-D-erythro-pentofuranosid-2-ulose 2-reductase